MKYIYVFSGLGTDERVFQNIDFGETTTFIRWIKPDDGETIEGYAKRLTGQIKHDRPILIGLSFGGLMAIEVAKLIETDKIIIIASAKARKEIPFYYRIAGQLKLHRILPTRFLVRPGIFNNWLFGTQTPKDKKLLAEILLDTDASFARWAIDKIVTWKNQTQHMNLKHIHGTADRILPYRFVTCDLAVKNGGHLMTVNKADELTEKIKSLL